MIMFTKRMLDDMPERYRGQWVYYTLLTRQYGPIGESSPKKDIMDVLSRYHTRYDPGGQHEGFAEQVIGFNMVGTYTSAAAYQIMRENQKASRRKMKKLRFGKMVTRPPERCNIWKDGRQCVKSLHHQGRHQFKS
jgi:hypothetical protein